MTAINPTILPNYQELLNRIKQYASKRYGGRVIDGPIAAFSAGGPLSVGDKIRKKKYKGEQTARLTFDKIQKSSNDNWSEEIYEILRVNPSGGYRHSTYIIEDSSGNEQPGVWDRAQLLLIPDSTPDMSESESESDDDDDNPLDMPAPPPLVLDRPQTRGNNHRFDIGDVLLFTREWFQGEPVPLGGNNARAREGEVTATAIFAGRAVYDLKFTLINGRQVSERYEAKSRRANPVIRPDDALDSSQFVNYIHS